MRKRKARHFRLLLKTTNYLMIELLQLILLFAFPLYALSGCLCNNRTRQQVHLERRQALRDRQRMAVLSGRSVRSVIETEVESETTQCPRLNCVRMAPRLKEQSEVYERLDTCASAIDMMEGPPFELVVEKPKNARDRLESEHSTSTESMIVSV